MSETTKNILRNSAGEAVPQYYNSSVDEYQVAKGSNGAINTQVMNASVHTTVDNASIHTVVDSGSINVTIDNETVHTTIDNTSVHAIIDSSAVIHSIVDSGTITVGNTSLAATVADGASVTLGAKADAAVTNPASSASEIALLKGILTQLSGTGSVNITGTAPKTVTATIASAASLSGEINLEGYKYMAIMMPAEWTAADLTFQASNTTGGTFYDVYDDSGMEVTVTAAATRIISLDSVALKLAPLKYIKIRSGISSTAVSQAAERTLTIILKN